MLLRLFADVLLTTPPQGRATNFFRFAQGDGSRRIELEGFGVIHSREQVDDVVERPTHVPADFLLAQVPATLLLDEMENSLPRFSVGDVDHAAKNSAVGRRAEDRRTENAVQMLVRMRMVAQYQLLRRATEALADVHVEPTFPVAVAECSRRRRDGELVGHEVIVRD